MRTVLVTGVTKGLGLAIAKRLLNDGYRVFGIGRVLTNGVLELINSFGEDRISFTQYDLFDIEGIPKLVGSITAKTGPLYGLVNNAAIGIDGVLATMHASDITRVLRVNLEAPIVLAKFGCRSMFSSKQGRIVNVASIIATTGFNGLSVYAASKAGLIGFTRSLAREVGRANITVNCVAPGFMVTDMTSGLDEEKMQSIRRRTPLGLVDPVDVAASVGFLLSDDARRITGTTITVDGGSTA